MITALQLIDDLVTALNSNDLDKLNVHIKSTDISAGDASAANQSTMITALQLIDDLRNALNSVATDKLDINLKTSDVSIGDATAANQTTMITALQLIDDLRGALGSVNTDDIQVDVKTIPTTTVQSLDGDKIWAFNAIVEEQIQDSSLPAGTSTLTGTNVPAGKIYVITHVMFIYTGTPPGACFIFVDGLASGMNLITVAAPGSGFPVSSSVNVYLQEGDSIDITVVGATLNDDLLLRYSGYEMNI